MRRLSPALLTMVMLGVVGLLVAMYFAKSMFAKEEIPDPDPIQNIPMALTDLAPGTKITKEHIGTGRARRSSVTRETVISDRILIGRIVKEKIAAATPILSSTLYPPNEGPPLALEEGMRAVTVSLGGSSAGTLQLVTPGQYVDLLFTPENLPNYDSSGGLIMTLFKGVKIIAMNGVTSGGLRSSRGAPQVTFELSPEQANILLLAEMKGKLDITYTDGGKGSGVVAVEDENRATLNQILGIDPPDEPEKEKAFTTEVYPGTNRGLRTFVDGKMTDRYFIEQRDYNPNNDPRNRNNYNRGPWSRTGSGQGSDAPADAGSDSSGPPTAQMDTNSPQSQGGRSF